MALIRVKKTATEYITIDPDHNRLSRRDFLAKGVATGAMTVMLPKFLTGSLIQEAYAAASDCPSAPTLIKGAIAQIHGNGGPTMSNRILSDEEANLVATNATAAQGYGVIPTDIVRLGPNFNVAASSPFGATLIAGPGGTYTADKWKAVLAKCSGGGHAGAFRDDDGAGENQGHLGAVASYRPNAMNKDLRFGTNVTPAPWGNGVPGTTQRGNYSPTTLANAFSLTPAASTTGMTPQTMGNTATAADALGAIFGAIFGNSGRKAGKNLALSASCGFYGDKVLADPAYAKALFDPTQIAALNANIVAGNTLTQQELALLSSFYQSATGQAGGVQIQGGSDYHNNTGAQIAGTDIAAARALVLFIAACDQAQSKGAFIMTANGNASCGDSGGNGATNGVIPNVTVGTATYNVGGAEGDGGGFYNKGHLLVFDPQGSAPTLKTTGQFSATNGSVKADPNVGTVPLAVAGLYLSAFTFLGLSTGKLMQAMQSQGVSSTSGIILL